jgi:hypothetical protein
LERYDKQLKNLDIISFPEQQARQEQPGPSAPQQEQLCPPVWRRPPPERLVQVRPPGPALQPSSRKQQWQSWPGVRPVKSNTFSCEYASLKSKIN